MKQDRMLELQGLTRRFGATTAVDGVSLVVPAGQMVGIIGRSGAGKSTLLRLVNRLVEPSAGRILARRAGRAGAPRRHRAARAGAAGLAARTAPWSSSSSTWCSGWTC